MVHNKQGMKPQSSFRRRVNLH